MRWWMIVLLVLLVIVLVVWFITANTTFLQVAFIRALCAGNAGVKPNDYDAVVAKIDTLGTDVSYESAFDNGMLDLYAAKGDAALPLPRRTGHQIGRSSKQVFGSLAILCAVAHVRLEACVRRPAGHPRRR